ncbi:hypothetical protein M9Y10_012201 [Tritrichomonas musculus]|uniref:UBA domain-containing protein n=1 Tax=Tritrichomonas musculus TaxID=1915356 RepID=A0ABR2IC22_9EUKA
MKVRLISPDRKEISFDYDEDTPFTFNTMKNILQNQFDFKSILTYSFFHNKSQITRSSQFTHSNIKNSNNSNENDQQGNKTEENQAKKEMVISYLSKLEFPAKSFPQTDYCFPLDFPLFIGKNAENESSLFYPPMEGPKCIMSGNTNLTNLVEDTIEQAAAFSNLIGIDPSLEALAESLVNDNLDIGSIRNFVNNFGDDRVDQNDSNSRSSIIQRRTQFGNLIQVQQGQNANNSTQKTNGHDNNNNSNNSNSHNNNNNNNNKNDQPNSHVSNHQSQTPQLSTPTSHVASFKPPGAVTKRKHKTSSRRHLFESNAHPEEEEKDNEDAFEEYDDEEEDLAEGIDEIMEMKENYEESMTPEIEQSVERLTKLGFDRNLVTPLLFMLGDEEKTMQFLQKTFDAMQS